MHSVSELFDFDAFPEVDFPKDGFIVICRARNEMLRLPFFLKHYRGIGAKHFFIIDNASEDETSEYLSAQPDVTILFTSKPYKTLKRNWLLAVLNEYCTDRWVLLADADEQFLYPGWPEVSLNTLTDYWDKSGAEGVIAPLIDMYSELPLKDVKYTAGEPFLSACHCFDGTSTWALPKASEGRTPNFEVRGGIRGRLFGIPPKRALPALLNPFRHYYLSPAQAHRDLPLKSYFQRRLSRFLPKQVHNSPKYLSFVGILFTQNFGALIALMCAQSSQVIGLHFYISSFFKISKRKWRKCLSAKAIMPMALNTKLTTKV